MLDQQEFLQERFRLARQRHELAFPSNLAHMEPLFNQGIQDALRTSGALRHRHERMELRNRTRAAAAANIHNDQATTNSGENNSNTGTTQQPHRRESTRQSERNAAQQRINAAAAAAENQREEVIRLIFFYLFEFKNYFCKFY